ncbi:MAG: hypothetical protein L7F78_00720 [Syntrophales bacterium LBB04]|nr:hypothetical protein [Syntrophales bacterium LBB04]
MNRIGRIANPVVILVLICAFVYIYFFYLKGDNPHSLTAPPAETEQAWDQARTAPPAETEQAWDNMSPENPNAVAAAGPIVQQQNPIGQPIQQNPVQPPNQLNAPQGNPGNIPPSQQNQNAPLQPVAVPDKALQEGHWIGLEVISLTPAIAKANSIPPDVAGVLIDEVTLLSAEVGLYAGDVITAVNGKKVTDLKSFHLATKEVAQSNRANVSVYSGGKSKDIVVFSTEALGIAQMEAAPMILATDKSPHGRYGPCDKCHAISKTPLNSGQLAKDQGDSLTKVAPNIRRGTPPPHRKRGTCTLCHVVL